MLRLTAALPQGSMASAWGDQHVIFLGHTELLLLHADNNPGASARTSSILWPTVLNLCLFGALTLAGLGARSSSLSDMLVHLLSAQHRERVRLRSTIEGTPIISFGPIIHHNCFASASILHMTAPALQLP